MKNTTPHLAVTGAAMDEVIPVRHGRKRWIAAGVVALGVLFVFGAWRLIPRGMQVAAVDVRTAKVESGIFLDEVVVRSKAEALNSVILDSVESGRVEEVHARDGALVKQGEILFRISNPQRHLELLQRQSEHAQQISNLANLRVAFEAGNTEHQRRQSELSFALSQTRKKHARNLDLHKQGFVSNAVVEESADTLAQQQRALEDERLQGAAESGVKRAAVEQMERATKTIEKGLALVNGTVEALVVRAPAAGRLTDFKLQVGQTVKNDQHIGRIDDPGRFKLAAGVDEYYLSRVAVGRVGTVRQDGQDYALEVGRVFPQIKDGRFSIELMFKDKQPASLNPGQSLDAQVTLGEPKPALLLPAAPFMTDTGGAWAFVLAPNGVDAERRELKTGRRNNRQVEVLSGLKAGETVLVSSYANFRTAERLQIKK